MGNHTKKQGEIKTWNEGKPHMIGATGALGLIGGVAGKAVKMLNFANIRSAIKQYVGKGKVATKPIKNLRGSTWQVTATRDAKVATKPKGGKAAYDHPAAKTFRETGKTPTQTFRETGKHTTKQFEHPSVSGYSKTTGKWVDL
jgi:hypothetical protein